MGDADYSRRHHLSTLWRESALGKWLAGGWTVFGVLEAARDEFLKPQYQDQFRLLNLIPHVSTAWLITGFAIALSIWMFEASYRSQRHALNTIASLQKKVAYLLEPQAVVANWPIQEAFKVIGPDVLKTKTWDKVGNRLVDLLSTGRVVSWGRKVDRDLGHQLPLVPIPQSFWMQAMLSFSFLDGPPNYKHPEAYTRPVVFETMEEYTDIQFNRKQLETAWGIP